MMGVARDVEEAKGGREKRSKTEKQGAVVIYAAATSAASHSCTRYDDGFQLIGGFLRHVVWASCS
jgi:hypothetical protein